MQIGPLRHPPCMSATFASSPPRSRWSHAVATCREAENGPGMALARTRSNTTCQKGGTQRPGCQAKCVCFCGAASCMFCGTANNSSNSWTSKLCLLFCGTANNSSISWTSKLCLLFLGRPTTHPTLGPNARIRYTTYSHSDA